MNTIGILDKIKREFSLTSDYQLAKKLAVSPSRIANYRSGRSTMDDELILKVENLLDMPPGSLLLEMHAERTKCTKAARIMRDLSARLLSTAAALLLSVSVAYMTPVSDAGASPLPHGSGTTVYYVKWLLCLAWAGFFMDFVYNGWFRQMFQKSARFSLLQGLVYRYRLAVSDS